MCVLECYTHMHAHEKKVLKGSICLTFGTFGAFCLD